MIRRPPRSTQSRSSAASDVYKRQLLQPLAAGRWEAVRPVAGWRRQPDRRPPEPDARLLLREVPAGGPRLVRSAHGDLLVQLAAGGAGEPGRKRQHEGFDHPRIRADQRERLPGAGDQADWKPPGPCLLYTSPSP